MAAVRFETSPGEFEKRRKRYREFMAREGLDGLLVTHLPDVRYLCGFSGSSGMALLLRGGGFFLTDFRYREQSALEVVGLRPVIYETNAEEAAAGLLRRRGGLRLGFDPAALSYAGVVSLRRRLKGVAGLVPLKGSLALLRATKSPSELKRIAMGIGIAEKAFVKALEEVGGDGTEFAFAAAVDAAARNMGAEGPSFETIVAGGSRGALVHASPSRRRLGGATVIDWGVVFEGYCTDTTRTVAFGKVPPRLRKAHRAVLDAQERAMEVARPGAKAGDVDRAAREVIEKAGFGEAFGHGLGHGVGLEVHERPYVGRASNDILEEGMVFTNEPGVYLHGTGGVRVEDMVLVTRDGAEFLTTLPRSLGPSDY
ncbi:MAG: Xaa-Pro peptidase family protein [Actinomycetota bacterium]|nr:Xaa-Pro peptidase family protein [Actinomycetota bacterium]MDD5666038.1 Xaa-Pro peptidase family protein [Actinomycetota bacterium]